MPASPPLHEAKYLSNLNKTVRSYYFTITKCLHFNKQMNEKNKEKSRNMGNPYHFKVISTIITPIQQLASFNIRTFGAEPTNNQHIELTFQ